MSDLVLPHTLVAGTPENVNDVQENFEAIRDKVNAGLDLDNLAAAVLELLIPVGTLICSAAASAPPGYLLCDGASYDRTTFAALFAAISTAYGSVDGSHFNVPDLRGRTAVGRGTHGDVDTLGDNEGFAAVDVGKRRQKHKHTITDAGSHTHGPSSGFTGDNNLNHYYDTGGAGGLSVAATSSGLLLWLGVGSAHKHDIQAGGLHHHDVGPQTGSESTDQGAFVVVNYFIRA